VRKLSAKARLDESAKCKRGHVLTLENSAFTTKDGRVQRRCRKCRNQYHKELGRIVRWEARVKTRMEAALRVVEQVTARPLDHAPEVVKAAIAFGVEARRQWRRRITPLT
jgi:DNA gyrase/topoisomerase IV subunit B